MSNPLRELARSVRRELTVYRKVLADPRTPRPARWCLGFALGYLVTPVDLIPDWIPILGQLDDAIIVPGLIWIALRMIPRSVIEECRRQVRETESSTPSKDSPPG